MDVLHARPPKYLPQRPMWRFNLLIINLRDGNANAVLHFMALSIHEAYVDTADSLMLPDFNFFLLLEVCLYVCSSQIFYNTNNLFQDLHLFVTEEDDENELIIASILQGFFVAATILVRILCNTSIEISTSLLIFLIVMYSSVCTPKLKFSKILI